MQSQNTIDGDTLFNGDESENRGIRSNYSEVRRRRILAFIVDYIIIAILCIPAAALIGFAGILTFGLGWILYAAMVPLVVFAYLGFTMGGEKQATIGMAMFSIHIRRLDGRQIDAPLAILHGILFWFIHSLLSPFMLLASLFSSRKRLLQDWLLDTEVVYKDVG